MGFYGPPTLGINCHEGGKGGGGGGGGTGVVIVKEEEESDGAAVIYEVIQDCVHWCQRGEKSAGEKEGKLCFSHGKVLPLRVHKCSHMQIFKHSCSRRRGRARGSSE